MESSFYKGLKKIKKSFYSDKETEVEVLIKELLYKNVSLDAEVLDDLYFKYCSTADNIFDSAIKLSDMVDLFNGEYDETNDPLEKKDWLYIRTLVDANAEEMDLDIITYIMRLIVQRGLI